MRLKLSAIIFALSTGAAMAQLDFPTLAGAAGVDPSGAMDSTAGIQAVLAANPKGTIVAPMPSVAYKIAGTLKLNKAQQLLCAQGATFTCTNTTAACVVIADPSGGYSIADITGCTFNGPGVGNSSVGVFMGGDPTGVNSPKTYFADGATMHNVHISGFNSGLKFGNNTWGTRDFGSQIEGNGYSVWAPPGLTDFGENMAFFGTSVFNSTVGFENDGGADLKLYSVSCDFNAICAQGVNLFLQCFGCHMETNAGPFFVNPYGSVIMKFEGGEIQYDAPTGSDNEIFNLYAQNVILQMSGTFINSAHPVTYLVSEATGANASPTMSFSQVYGNKIASGNAIAHLTNNSANPNLSTFGVSGIAP